MSHYCKTLTNLIRISFLIGALMLKGQTAHADVPDGQLAHVYMNVGDNGTPTQQSQYQGLIQSLRAAAGHPFRNGVMQTQSGGTGLIHLTLTVPAGTLRLWITPQDLYVRGFTNVYGETYYFDDAGFNFTQVMDQANAWGAIPNPSGTISLGYGSNYNNMSQIAGGGRERLQISYQTFRDAVYNLAWTSLTAAHRNYDQAKVARSLMLMIQLMSEAARFNDVYGVGSDIMGSNSPVYNGLPLPQQYLENSWASISNYGYAVSQNPNTAPLNVTGIDPFNLGGPATLWSFNDVQRYLAMMTSNPWNSNTGGISGDWSHTEL